MALTWDEVDAHVQDKYIPVLMDQFFNATPLLAQLKAKARIVFDSGRQIDQPVNFGELNGDWYTGLDTFDVTTKETTTLAKFDWKQIYINVTLDGLTILKIEGDEKILSIVATKMENAGITFNRRFTQALYANKGANAIIDMQRAMGTTGSYGGIDKAAYSWWRGQADTTGGAFSMDMLQNMYGLSSDGPLQPDLIITTQKIYDKIWLRVQPQQRGNLDNTPGLARVGFTGISFNKATIIVDKHCPAGFIFVLNTDFWKLVTHRRRNMTWTEKKIPINQDAWVRQLLWAGALICQSPRWQGIISNVT